MVIWLDPWESSSASIVVTFDRCVYPRPPRPAKSRPAKSNLSFNVFLRPLGARLGFMGLAGGGGHTHSGVPSMSRQMQPRSQGLGLQGLSGATGALVGGFVGGGGGQTHSALPRTSMHSQPRSQGFGRHGLSGAVGGSVGGRVGRRVGDLVDRHGRL